MIRARFNARHTGLVKCARYPSEDKMKWCVFLYCFRHLLRCRTILHINVLVTQALEAVHNTMFASKCCRKTAAGSVLLKCFSFTIKICGKMFWMAFLSQTNAISVNIPRVSEVVALDVNERADRLRSRAVVVKCPARTAWCNRIDVSSMLMRTSVRPRGLFLCRKLDQRQTARA